MNSSRVHTRVSKNISEMPMYKPMFINHLNTERSQVYLIREIAWWTSLEEILNFTLLMYFETESR